MSQKIWLKQKNTQWKTEDDMREWQRKTVGDSELSMEKKLKFTAKNNRDRDPHCKFNNNSKNVRNFAYTSGPDLTRSPKHPLLLLYLSLSLSLFFCIRLSLSPPSLCFSIYLSSSEVLKKLYLFLFCFYMLRCLDIYIERFFWASNAVNSPVILSLLLYYYYYYY